MIAHGTESKFREPPQ